MDECQHLRLKEPSTIHALTVPLQESYVHTDIPAEDYRHTIPECAGPTEKKKKEKNKKIRIFRGQLTKNICL